MSEIIVEIRAEELRSKLGVVTETAESMRDKLETLEGDERLDKKAIKGIEKLEKRIEDVAQLPRGGGMTKGAADMYYTTLTGVSKTLTYNSDGTVASMTDLNGSKTFNYTNGVLTSITGTGNYRSKALAYSTGQLTTVTIS